MQLASGVGADSPWSVAAEPKIEKSAVGVLKAPMSFPRAARRLKHHVHFWMLSSQNLHLSEEVPCMYMHDALHAVLPTLI